MVKISKMLNINHSAKACLKRLYKELLPKTTIKKGLTVFYSCKPLLIMVGTKRFELLTSTVSR